MRLIWLTMLVGLVGCNPRADYALVGSAEVPGTHGEMEVEEIDQDQLLVTLVLDRVPPPERLEEGMTHYVLWFDEGDEAAPELKAVFDFDRETMTAKAMATTSWTSFRVLVTAEPGPSPTEPSDIVVSKQVVNED